MKGMAPRRSISCVDAGFINQIKGIIRAPCAITLSLGAYTQVHAGFLLH